MDLNAFFGVGKLEREREEEIVFSWLRRIWRQRRSSAGIQMSRDKTQLQVGSRASRSINYTLISSEMHYRPIPFHFSSDLFLLVTVSTNHNSFQPTSPAPLEKHKKLQIRISNAQRCCSLSRCRRHPKNEACESSLGLFLELPTSACKKKKEEEPWKKQHVLPLLCIVIYFSYENGSGAQVGWDEKENLHGILGASSQFWNAKSKKVLWRSAPATCVAVILSAWMVPWDWNQHFWRVSSVVAAPGETLPMCPAI